ncbi:MAG: TspO/MBR family protein [Eubacterium sp.]
MKWKYYIGSVLLVLAVGTIAGILTREGAAQYAEMTKPVISPPAVLFPIVWTILYTLMGIGLARIWMSEATPVRNQGLNLFWLQLFFNFMWSILFFNFGAYGIAFFWLLVLLSLILAMTAKWYKTDSIAVKLQIPYALWVAFAGYLNFAVWQLNR